MRRTIDRLVGSQRRVLVVPLPSPTEDDQNLKQFLQGYSYEVATRDVISDSRLVDWLLSRTAAQ